MTTTGPRVPILSTAAFSALSFVSLYFVLRLEPSSFGAFGSSSGRFTAVPPAVEAFVSSFLALASASDLGSSSFFIVVAGCCSVLSAFGLLTLVRSTPEIAGKKRYS